MLTNLRCDAFTWEWSEEVNLDTIRGIIEQEFCDYRNGGCFVLGYKVYSGILITVHVYYFDNSDFKQD